MRVPPTWAREGEGARLATDPLKSPLQPGLFTPRGLHFNSGTERPRPGRGVEKETWAGLCETLKPAFCLFQPHISFPFQLEAKLCPLPFLSEAVMSYGNGAAIVLLRGGRWAALCFAYNSSAPLSVDWEGLR